MGAPNKGGGGRGDPQGRRQPGPGPSASAPPRADATWRSASAKTFGQIARPGKRSNGPLMHTGRKTQWQRDRATSTGRPGAAHSGSAVAATGFSETAQNSNQVTTSNRKPDKRRGVITQRTGKGPPPVATLDLHLALAAGGHGRFVSSLAADGGTITRRNQAVHPGKLTLLQGGGCRQQIALPHSLLVLKNNARPATGSLALRSQPFRPKGGSGGSLQDSNNNNTNNVNNYYYYYYWHYLYYY